MEDSVLKYWTRLHSKLNPSHCCQSVTLNVNFIQLQVKLCLRTLSLLNFTYSAWVVHFHHKIENKYTLTADATTLFYI